MNRPDLTGVPVRVTSVTSTVPLDVVTSTRRPAFVASISYFSTPPSPESTTISTRSPLIDQNVTGCLRHIARTTRELNRLWLDTDIRERELEGVPDRWYLCRVTK